MDLNGLWRFQVDAYEDGEMLGYQAEDCDTRLWREAEVPCSFDECHPAMAAYEGVGWYRRTLHIPEEWCARHLALRFEGVNYNAQVWVNGLWAGEHEGGFLRFEIPVHPMARPGKNTLAVRVDNTRRKGEVPGLQRGWRPYGGILREVTLVVRDHLRIIHPVIQASADGTLKARVFVANGRDIEVEARVRAHVRSPDGETVISLETPPQKIPPGAEALFQAETRVNAIPWTPDDPALYTVAIELVEGAVIDGANLRIGFRSIEAKGSRLLLNGTPIYLRGFNRHEDSLQAGMKPNPKVAGQDLKEMKALGCNFVRLCHYPHHPSTLDLCDEIGMLAMAEIPLYWWDGLREGDEACKRKKEAALRQLREMIERDINHPSIIFWSVSNETMESLPEVAAGNAELISLAHLLDPTRLAAHVSSYWTEHPHFDNDDVLCVNGYPSWMRRGFEKQASYDFAESGRWWQEELSRLHALFPDRPILITEYGYPAHEGILKNALGEDAQVAAITAEERAFHKPYICGSTIWCYADHPWPEEDFIRRLTLSPFGIVTRERRKKRIWHHLRQVWGPAPQARPPVPASAENVPVHMVRPHMENIPFHPFPEGFGVRAFRMGDQGIWTDIQRDAEPFFAIEDDLFEREFGYDLPAACRRCFFIVDHRGCAVGTISAWYSRDFKGQDYGRIHWVAVRPAYQRRGLARAGMSYTMLKLAQWHERAWLSTSTSRIGAIKLYLDFGFLPDLDTPGAREAWAGVRDKLSHPVLAQMEL